MTSELLFVFSTMASVCTLPGEEKRTDGLLPCLIRFAEALESGHEPSLEAEQGMWPVFHEAAQSGLADFDPVLRRIAEAASMQQDCNCELICSALDCLWWSTRPVSYLKENVEQWKENPHLAAGSMRMLARDAEPGTWKCFLLIYEAARRSKACSAVACLEEGAKEAATTEYLRVECARLGPIDRVHRLARAAHGGDWETTDVWRKEMEAGVEHTNPFIPGRDVCGSAVHWAREQLRQESVRDPMLVAVELSNHEAELRSSSRDQRTCIRVPAVMSILVYRVIDPVAAEIWEKLNWNRGVSSARR